MAKFLANWRVEGLKDKPVELGDVVDAKPEDVAELVAVEYGGKVAPLSSAVLTPCDKDGKPQPVPTVVIPAAVVPAA